MLLACGYLCNHRDMLQWAKDKRRMGTNDPDYRVARNAEKFLRELIPETPRNVHIKYLRSVELYPEDNMILITRTYDMPEGHKYQELEAEKEVYNKLRQAGMPFSKTRPGFVTVLHPDLVGKVAVGDAIFQERTASG